PSNEMSDLPSFVQSHCSHDEGAPLTSKHFGHIRRIRTVNQVSRRTRDSRASESRSGEDRKENAEGRPVRPSAARQVDSRHPHASRRTPLNLLCERKLSTHSLVP